MIDLLIQAEKLYLHLKKYVFILTIEELKSLRNAIDLELSTRLKKGE